MGGPPAGPSVRALGVLVAIDGAVALPAGWDGLWGDRVAESPRGVGIDVQAPTTMVTMSAATTADVARRVLAIVQRR